MRFCRTGGGLHRPINSFDIWSTSTSANPMTRSRDAWSSTSTAKSSPIADVATARAFARNGDRGISGITICSRCRPATAVPQGFIRAFTTRASPGVDRLHRPAESVDRRGPIVKAKPNDARFRNLYAYRGSIWYERVHAGKRYRVDLETQSWHTAADRRDAYEVLHEIPLVRTATRSVAMPTLRDFVKRYLESDVAHLAETT